ncbi:MAG: hypothetical protein AMXMBFR33_41360 [Candidatus Xenobia bacterium]
MDTTAKLEEARAALARASSMTEEQARARAAELLAAAELREEQAALARRVSELELEALRENIRQAAAAMPDLVAERDQALARLDAALADLRPRLEDLAEKEAAITAHWATMGTACDAARARGMALEAAGDSTLIPPCPAPVFALASPSEVAGPFGAAGFLARRIMAMREAGSWPARL